MAYRHTGEFIKMNCCRFQAKLAAGMSEPEALKCYSDDEVARQNKALQQACVKTDKKNFPVL